MGLCEAEPVIDAVAGESTHVFFCFRFGPESSLTGEFDIMPISEVDMAFPRPHVVLAVSLQDPDERLVAV